MIIRLFLCSLLSIVHAQDEPHVTINGNVDLLGFKLQSRENRSIHAFRGIPFAEPPVGELRFQRAKPKQWSKTGETYNATYFRSKCIQPRINIDLPKPGSYDSYYWDIRNISKANGLLFIGDEDCLMLNVYYPAEYATTNTKLPVLFFIHGGGFVNGAGTFNPAYLLDRNIVLVTTQYRLGPLGFLSMQNDIIPGNAGILDLIDALTWVQSHISQFHGDPTQVTIMGQSAGAALVTYLMISPMAAGLFRGVIADSGAAIAPWAFDPDPITNGIKIAKLAGCNDTTLDELSECLKTRSLGNLMLGFFLNAVGERLHYGGMIFRGTIPSVSPPFGFPVVPKKPSDILEKGEYTAVPLLIGSNKNDASFIVDLFYNVYIRPFNRAHNEEFIRYKLINLLIEAARLPDPTLMITDMMETKYLSYVPYSHRANFTALLSGLLDFTTTNTFKAASVRVADLNALYYAPSYLYTFNYLGEFTYSGGNSLYKDAVTHGDELIYLSPRSWVKFNQQDLKFSKLLVNLWVNFVETGKPTGYNVNTPNWPEYGRPKQEYFVIDKVCSVKSNYSNEFIITISERNSISERNNGGFLKSVPSSYVIFFIVSYALYKSQLLI